MSQFERGVIRLTSHSEHFISFFDYSCRSPQRSKPLFRVTFQVFGVSFLLLLQQKYVTEQIFMGCTVLARPEHVEIAPMMTTEGAVYPLLNTYHHDKC